MNRIKLDAVLVQAVIAGSLSFAHIHDVADAAGQDGWKAWAYPISVDLLLVAAWRRLRTFRGDRTAWFWFGVALVASLGANVATAGLLDLTVVPAWLRILVAGWPALAFLGGSLLIHQPDPEPEHEAAGDENPVVLEREESPAAPALPAPAQAPAESMPAAAQPEPVPHPVPVPETPAPAPPAVKLAAPSVPPALLDHARKVADAHRASTGQPMPAATLRYRLGLPEPLANAITSELQLA
ncbi:DUF2637 domain-containing protein [Streptomyces sp. WA1-19]|uniref:DUF2637 domain-containing protein n=1 Tax=Streptomyces sp. WA1-19 TaxID=2884220 RepID=UPI001D04C814|nr:DUF2637 domain-containing protein [Streptomyces sp. WA1-19]UDF11371.1 DUF2637 domain-containing protein [Streptomyces sp. WA1-19]